MRFVVKFVGIVAIALFFTSCHNDVPELPTPDEVDGYKFCKYGTQCKSLYEISKEDCKKIKGEFYSDKECKILWVEEP